MPTGPPPRQGKGPFEARQSGRRHGPIRSPSRCWGNAASWRLVAVVGESPNCFPGLDGSPGSPTVVVPSGYTAPMSSVALARRVGSDAWPRGSPPSPASRLTAASCRCRSTRTGAAQCGRFASTACRMLVEVQKWPPAACSNAGSPRTREGPRPCRRRAVIPVTLRALEEQRFLSPSGRAHVSPGRPFAACPLPWCRACHRPR